MTFKMEPLTLHSGKSTPDLGPHRSSAVLILHPLQAPWLQPNHHGQFRVSSDLQPDDHIPPQAHAMSPSMSVSWLSSMLPTQPPAQHWGWSALQPPWGNPQPVEHGTQWKSPSRESSRRHLCASQEILADLSSLWPPKNPPKSTPILLNPVVFLSLSCSPCPLTSGIISPIKYPKSEAPKSLSQVLLWEKPNLDNSWGTMIQDNHSKHVYCGPGAISELCLN